MSLLSLLILALGMSIDAFVAALGRGAVASHSWGGALKTGLIFGLAETVTPLLGWAIGSVAHAYVQPYDHWIALALLSAVGLSMILGAVRGNKTRHESSSVAPPRTFGLGLLLTAFATSLDAMIIGVTLSFTNTNIWLAAACIGLVSTLMATLGIRLGGVLSATFGRWAEALGGLVLMGLGAFVVVDHLQRGI